jgi:PAS domain S-box-containing protein
MKDNILEGQSLQWLMQSVTEAMLIADEAGNMVLVNPSLERLFDYPAAELVGQPIEMLIPTRFRHAHVGQRTGYFGQPRARSMGVGMELFARRRSGEEFPVEVSLSPLKTDRGVALAVATIYDITRRKQAEAALQESEARMRAIVDTAVDAIVTIDERGLIERFNQAAERLFGYAAAEVAGKNVSVLMPSPYRERHDGYLAHYLHTGEKKIIGKGREVTGQRKDGSVFPMDLAVAEMQFGERRMFTGIVRDITRSKRAEEALMHSQAELRQLSAHQERIKEEERKRIAQEIHDELGGLLTGIKAYVSVSVDRAIRAGTVPDPLLVDATNLADTAIKTVRKVISDLRPSVLDQLGVWAAIEWYLQQIGERAGLQCESRIDPEATSVALGQERSTMLFRVIQETLTNVVRHAQASRVTIDAVREDGCVLVTVIDDGKGIDTDRLLNRESWGILGMYERTRHFGGELKIAGTPGRGTTVVLKLPLEHPDG